MQRYESDWFLNKEASMLLCRVITHPDATVPDKVTSEFLAWVKAQLQSTDLLHVMTVVGVLRKLLLVAKYRDVFGPAVLPLLEAVASQNISQLKFQLLYEVCMSMWLCLFNKELAATPAVKLVTTLASVARQITKEKVRRMSIASLALLAACRENRQAMIACHVDKLVASLLAQKQSDKEFIEDLQALQAALETEVNEMSSWDRYKTEALSGQLDWSPPHRSEHFWREYAGMFEENHWEVLLKLRDILQNPNSTPRALSVCCFDIGEFARYHPRAKQFVHSNHITPPPKPLTQNNAPGVCQQGAGRV